MKTYSLDYPLDGRWYSVYIRAENWEEAERHVQGLCWAKVHGELIASFPIASRPIGNFFRKLFGGLRVRKV